MKLHMIPLILASILLALSCSDDAEDTIVDVTLSEEIEDATPVDLSAFMLGADISWTTQLESEGYSFYNSSGTKMECTALMKEIGMNAIRLRVWVDPEAGWCNEGDVLAKALRAKRLGMRIMIDFHYSDEWADPSQQLIPSAWVGLDADGLADAVSDHTKEVLGLLSEYGVDVSWVQVGNETTHGVLIHSGTDSDGNVVESEYGGSVTDNPSYFTAYINAGYKAVKSVYPDAQVIVHVDRGQNIYYADREFTVLENYGGSYDIIGLSIYPGSDWEDNVANTVANISTLYESFGHDVMICEVGMDYSDASTAYSALSTLITGSKATGHCLGVFYWEPEAPAGYNGGYTMGAFSNNRPTSALDAFTEAASEN